MKVSASRCSLGHRRRPAPSPKSGPGGSGQPRSRERLDPQQRPRVRRCDRPGGGYRRCLQRQCDSTSSSAPTTRAKPPSSVAGEVAMANASPPRCSTSGGSPAAHDGHRHADARLRRCAGAERVMQLASRSRRPRRPRRHRRPPGCPRRTRSPRPRRHESVLPTVVIVAVVVAWLGRWAFLLRRRSLRRRRQRRLLSPSADGRPAHQRRRSTVERRFSSLGAAPSVRRTAQTSRRSDSSPHRRISHPRRS